MTEYNNNSSGAKKYISDRIREMDFCDNPNIHVFNLIDAKVSGSLNAFHAIGLLDVFEYQELGTKQALAYKRYFDRITSPSEQI